VIAASTFVPDTAPEETTFVTEEDPTVSGDAEVIGDAAPVAEVAPVGEAQVSRGIATTIEGATFEETGDTVTSPTPEDEPVVEEAEVDPSSGDIQDSTVIAAKGWR